MVKVPKYPISAEPEPEPPPKPSPELYSYPSFKFRHEVRDQLESADAAHRRAYPHLYRIGPVLRRRSMRRGG